MIGGPGDEAFKTLFEPHRRAILLHCYRMLGSIHDAEEVVQDSLLRAWQRRDELRAAAALRAWLYQIATNACLDLLKSRRRRGLPHLVARPPATSMQLGAPVEERFWVEPAPDAWLEGEAGGRGARPDERMSERESIGLAFIAALQLLPPKQRAALLLIDVLGYRPEEAGALLATSEVSIRSLLQRARQSVAARQRELEPGDVSRVDEDLLGRFIASWERGDIAAFAALLAEDALLSMPPQPEWYRGRAAVSAFFAAIWAALPGERRLVTLEANGQRAVALYRRRPEPGARFEASAIVVLTMRAGLIAELIRFGAPQLFPCFDLPERLDDAVAASRAGGRREP